MPNASPTASRVWTCDSFWSAEPKLSTRGLPRPKDCPASCCRSLAVWAFEGYQSCGCVCGGGFDVREFNFCDQFCVEAGGFGAFEFFQLTAEGGEFGRGEIFAALVFVAFGSQAVGSHLRAYELSPLARTPSRVESPSNPGVIQLCADIIAARHSSSSTAVYRCVVAIDACPSNVCTARRFRVPRYARLAKRCRSVCIE